VILGFTLVKMLVMITLLFLGSSFVLDLCVSLWLTLPITKSKLSPIFVLFI
jgi:hypothetical protein